MTRVTFLIVDRSAASEEEQAAWSFLSCRKDLNSRQVEFARLKRDKNVLTSSDVVWWHFSSSGEIPSIAQSDTVKHALCSFVHRGGGLLLSLLAAPYVVDLGLEEVGPNAVFSGVWTEESWTQEHPDMRGFGSFQGHPIFAGFPGGAFSWAPVKGENYCAAFYENALPQQGKIVAVEKCYIKLNEHRRLIAEYDSGRGKVITVGAHLYYSNAHHRFRPHLEKLTGQIVEYLHRGSMQIRAQRFDNRKPRKTYWSFSDKTTPDPPRRSAPLRHCTLKLPVDSGRLEIHRDLNTHAGDDEFFDVAGQRTLIMGRERGGLSEVWCHPLRILQNLRVGFKVGASNVRWSESLLPEITIRPESFTRRYQIDGASIKEVCLAHPTQPAGTLCYEVRSDEPVDVVFSGTVDLRMMWPLSEQATAGLRFTWDSGLNAAVVTDGRRTLHAIIGVTCKPLDFKLAHSEQLALLDGSFVVQPTEMSLVAVGIRLRSNSTAWRFCFVFAGSNISSADAARAYRAMAENPARALKRKVSHFRALERNSVRLETPDVHLNESYRWSLCALDRLYVRTPAVGESLLAGYGPSTSGWNGGHEISGRPGYAWYFGRDSVWSGFALLGCGESHKVRAILEFLGEWQEETGKILHEMTTSGFAHFDAADATPLYLILMGRYLRRTGDRAFVRSQFERIQRAVNFCFSTDTDRDHLIENTAAGHGWIEGGPLFPGHVEHYLASCWIKALEESSSLALSVGKKKLARAWSRELRRVRNIVEREFWNAEKRFYRFAKLADGSFREEQTILPTVGMYFGCTDQSRSREGLAEFASHRFSADWGVRTIGIDNVHFRPSGYQSGSIWPLMTGWTSLAEFTCDRPLQGYSHLLCNLGLVSQFTAGCVEEVLHGEEFKPLGVCPHQAWSEAMVLLPILEGMFGLRVDATATRVHLQPYLPPQWNIVALKNVRVGNALIDIQIKRGANETEYNFTARASEARSRLSKEIAITLKPMFPLGTRISEITVGTNSQPQRNVVGAHSKGPTISFRLRKRTTIRIRHVGGVSLIPTVPPLKRGERSQGLRIIEEEWCKGTYSLTLEGVQGREYLCDIYDPSRSISATEGAMAIAREGNHTVLSVRFPVAEAPGSYVRKQVRLIT